MYSIANVEIKWKKSLAGPQNKSSQLSDSLTKWSPMSPSPSLDTNLISIKTNY